MFIQIGNEYLNVQHIVSVRFNDGPRPGQTEEVTRAEVTTVADIGRDDYSFALYGEDAQLLRDWLDRKAETYKIVGEKS